MLNKISQALDDLSTSERKVAECVLADPNWLMHAAVAEIAERAEVSQPTVIRFCRTLGFKGLPEFKLALSASIGPRHGVPFVHEELNSSDSVVKVMEKVIGNTVSSIMDYRHLFDADDLEAVLDVFTRARRIEFYGVGNSGIVAQDAQHKFFRFGLSTVAYVDTHIQLMAASVLNENDVLVAISNSGSAIEITDAVSIAKEAGAKVVAITRPNTPLAKMSDWVLNIETTEDNDLYAPMITRLLQLVVIDILAISLALRLGETASAQLLKGKQSVLNRRRGKPKSLDNQK